MGICASMDSTAVAATAKVIFPDGRLQEHGGYVTAAQALRKEPGGFGFFVCNADELEFGGQVAAVRAEETLQVGQIYFVLPKSMLGRKLQSEDMAALAVRASSALTKNGTVSIVVEGGCGAAEAQRKRLLEERRRRGERRGRPFAAELTVISE